MNDSSGVDFNTLGGFNIHRSGTTQLVVDSAHAFIGITVQIGVTRDSLGGVVFVQLFDGFLSDAGACLSRIDNTGGEEIVDVAAGEHGSTCNSNSGQTCDLQERTTRQNHNSILLKNNSTN